MTEELEQLTAFLKARFKEDKEAAVEPHCSCLLRHTNAREQLLAWTIHPDLRDNPMHVESLVESEWASWMQLPERILRFLALPYRDHPDYDDLEWPIDETG